MVSYQILYWHDIPLQVRAQTGRARFNQPLSQRFQVAVDHAAMAAGVTGDDAYTAEFHWSEPLNRAGTLEQVASAVAAEIEASYPQIDWKKTARALGATGPLDSISLQ